MRLASALSNLSTLIPRCLVLSVLAELTGCKYGTGTEFPWGALSGLKRAIARLHDVPRLTAASTLALVLLAFKRHLTPSRTWRSRRKSVG
ncbi:hypothetical protein ACFFWD_03345 [Bradyrhizobium erythrophlei]|uniref:hypothetical protein n=1 Tax=Bradyrhizobium erythrophlei TaxID=1437360 RepID=UPI0035EFDF8D